MPVRDPNDPNPPARETSLPDLKDFKDLNDLKVLNPPHVIKAFICPSKLDYSRFVVGCRAPLRSARNDFL